MEKVRFLHLPAFPSLANYFANAGKDINELKVEIIRKSMHFLIALSPSIAVLNRPFTITMLMTGVLAYSFMEYMRLSGVKVPLVSSITSMACRTRDMGRFVMGPVTLGTGAFLALLLYPPSVAAIAIYALAFGDGFASLVGKIFGKLRPAFLFGKSVEGSLACFTAVLISTYAIMGDMRIAFLASFTCMVVEALPIEDYDNVVIPVTVGMVVYIAYAML